MPRGFSRRNFLKATAGLVVVGVAARWARGLWTPGAVADTGQIVLMQDLRLDAGELSGGSLSGVRVEGGALSASTSAPGEYLSPELRTDFPVTHAGVHWRGGSSGVTFWLRGSADGLAWDEWQPVLVDAHGPEQSGETFGAPVRLDRARHLQFRARLEGDDEASAIDSVTVTALNAEDGPLASAPETAAAAAPSTKPLTYSREAWGANESLRFDGGDEIWPRDYVPTKKVVVHHTATGNSYSTVSQAQADVRAVYAYHAVSRGWGDIGYNWIIDKFGNSYEGRRGRDGPGFDGPGGRELVSEDVVAGHATSYNHGGRGVAMLGSFDTSSPSAAALSRLRDVLAWECGRHGIRPTASTDFLKADDTWHRGLIGVCGHRDVGSTACPGSAMYSRLPGLRSDTASRLADTSAPTVAITSAPAQGTRTDRQVSYTWQGSGGSGAKQYSYYLEGWSLDADVLVVYKSGFDSIRQPLWSGWTAATQANFALLSAGHYTFHVRVRDGTGRLGLYEDSRTLLANVSTIRPDTPGKIHGFAPGVSRD